MRTSGTTGVRARPLMVDGYELEDRCLEFAGIWEADELELRRPMSTRVSTCQYVSTWLAALLLLITTACATAPPVVAPIVVPPPPVVVVVPGPLIHDLTAWLDEDTVCVDVPKVVALYVARRCVAMATIRSLILTARNAEDFPDAERVRLGQRAVRD